jgi:hypothetical protein
VPLAGEAGLAVLIALRYLPDHRSEMADDYVLGWTTILDAPERIEASSELAVRAAVTQWLDAAHSLAVAIRSRVLPEADVVLLNPQHPAAAEVPPLTVRPFDFAECLHVPPMRQMFADNRGLTEQDPR